MPRKIPTDKKTISEFRKNIAKLKKIGLTKAGVDARSVKPTRYYLDKVKKNLDLIQGKAKLVKVSKTYYEKAAPEYQRSKKRVKVLTGKNERVRFSAKDDAVVSYSNKFGRRLKRIVFPSIDVNNLPRAPKGKTWYYVLPVGLGNFNRFSYDEIKALIAEYQKRKGFSNWLKYLEINEVVGRNSEDDFDNEE